MQKKAALRWDVPMIAREFGMDTRTVGKRLSAAELTGDHFTTKQIFAAIYGDMDAERLRLTKEQADKLALENQQSRGELINIFDLGENLGKFLSAARQRIMSNTKLDDDEKDKILKELGQCLGTVGGIGGAARSAV